MTLNKKFAFQFLKGKVVLFYDDIMCFDRYGTVKRPGRKRAVVKMPMGKLRLGTTFSVHVRLMDSVNERNVRLDQIKYVHWHGSDLPLEIFLEKKKVKP